MRRRKNRRFFLFYSTDMGVLNVIEMVENLEMYQTLFWIIDPQCTCSTMELRGYVALELFYSKLEVYQTQPKFNL